MATVGGVVSIDPLRTVTATVAVLVNPSESLATALHVCGPFGYDAVLRVLLKGAFFISVPRLFPSSLNWTPMSLPLSEAAALTVMVPCTAALFAGLVIDTAG